MTTIADIKAGVKLFGNFSGKIIRVEPARSVMVSGNSKTVQDLYITDGTGDIKVSIWEPTMRFMVGQNISLTGAYSKAYNGTYSIAVSRKGNYSVSGTSSPNTPASTMAPQNTEKPVVEYLSEEEIEKIIKEDAEITDDNVLNVLIKKNNANGLLERKDALIVIAKNLEIEDKIIKKPYNPLDDLPKKPYCLMDMEELLEWFAKTTNGATRGLIDKAIMHQQWLEITKTKLKLKKIELKLYADVHKIQQEYDKIREEKMKELEKPIKKAKKKTVPKKITKKKKNEPQDDEGWDENSIEFDE